MTSPTDPDTAILDLDGTLVDSVPVHVLAWQAAFRDVGLTVASHRLQRAIGMGGDRLVARVTSDSVENAVGDRVRARHAAHLDRHFAAITATDGASELLAALRERHIVAVLASSSDRDLTDRLLDLVEGADVLRSSISGDDADESKPAGDLVAAALREVDPQRAVVIGDSVWDVEAARQAGVPCLGVLTGGICGHELRRAGAVDVVDSPRELAERLRAGQPLVMGGVEGEAVVDGAGAS